MSKQNLFAAQNPADPHSLNVTQPIKLVHKQKLLTRIRPVNINSIMGQKKALSRVISQSPSHSRVKIVHKHSKSEVVIHPHNIPSSPKQNYLNSQKTLNAFIKSFPQHQQLLTSIQKSYEDYINYLKENPLLTRDTLPKDDSLEAAQAEIAKLRSREKYYKTLIKQLKKEKIPKIQVPVDAPAFHEEFMAHYPEFSESWRRQIDLQKR